MAQMMLMMLVVVVVMPQFLSPIYLTPKGVIYVGTPFTCTGTCTIPLLQMRKARLASGTAEVQRGLPGL